MELISWFRVQCAGAVSVLMEEADVLFACVCKNVVTLSEIKRGDSPDSFVMQNKAHMADRSSQGKASLLIFYY